MNRVKRKFTLIELLIVIAIIAILASMILPALRSALDKARAISCINNHKQLGTATIMYVDDNKGYFPDRTTNYSSQATSVKALSVLWGYVTHDKITEDYAYLKKVTTDGKRTPKLSMFCCPAVLDPFKVSEEMRHIGVNNFMGGSTYATNLFLSKCPWPSARMLYSDYYGPGYAMGVAYYTSDGPYTTSGYMTYLHPGLTASVTHLDGHVKAWNMHAVPKTLLNSRFWGEYASTGANP